MLNLFSILLDIRTDVAKYREVLLSLTGLS